MDENNRIRQALKSPIVMIGLCVFAGIAMYSNLADVFETQIVATSRTPVPGKGTISSAPSSSGAPSGIHYEDIAWIEHPNRDPFAAATTPTKPSAGVVSSTGGTTSTRSASLASTCVPMENAPLSMSKWPAGAPTVNALPVGALALIDTVT